MPASQTFGISIDDRSTSRRPPLACFHWETFLEYSVDCHPQEVGVLDSLGTRRPYVPVLQEQHVSVPQALLQKMAKNLYVVALLLLAHDRIKCEFLVSLVNATHCVVVIQDNPGLSGLPDICPSFGFDNQG